VGRSRWERLVLSKGKKQEGVLFVSSSFGADGGLLPDASWEGGVFTQESEGASREVRETSGGQKVWHHHKIPGTGRKGWFSGVQMVRWSGGQEGSFE